MVHPRKAEQPAMDVGPIPRQQRRQRGPVEALCREIGFHFDPRLERVDVFVAFVRVLVAEIEHERRMQAAVVKVGGAAPSEGSAEVLTHTHHMLSAGSVAALIARAALVHDAAYRLNPEEAYPADHLIDQLSSCASAIRFGLEEYALWGSRHAAEAASHVWRQRYGVRLFDSHTPDWEHAWARQKLMEALISLLPDGAGLRGPASTTDASKSPGMTP